MTVAKELSDFLTLDYASVVAGESATNLGIDWRSIFALFVNPAVPFCLVLAYWFLSNVVFKFIQKTFKIESKGLFMQCVVVGHSGLLAIYSLWTFYNTIMIVVPLLRRNGLYTTLCDTDSSVWDATGSNLGFWITHFYVSKYYEFVETWIVLLKAKEPIFLQTYHHAGVVLACWGFVVTKNTSSGGITVVLNSFIHSIMYTYYVAAALGYNSPLKHYLTQAQLLQFFSGILMTIPTLWIPNCGTFLSYIVFTLYRL